MFHSAGYFRGVRCPFFEHGLCHRPHCHYKHSKPGPSKPSPANSAPGIQPRLQVTTIANTHDAAVAKQVEPVPLAGSEGDGVKEEGGGRKGESLMKAVPQVVEAIGQISNYFGASAGQATALEQPYETVVIREGAEQPVARQPGDSGTAAGDSTAEAKGQSEPEQDSTAIGQLSRDTIGRLAGEIAQHLKGSSEEPCKEGSAATEVPSYAPEKCITSDGAYSRVEPGKGSLHEDTVELAPEVGSDRADGVSKLEGMLVSEKEIFGGPLQEKKELGEGGGIGEEPRVQNKGAASRKKGVAEVHKGKGAGVHTRARKDEIHKNEGAKDKGARMHKDEGDVVRKDDDADIHKDKGAGFHKDEGAGVRKGKRAGVYKDKGAGVHKDEGAGVHKEKSAGVQKDKGAEVHKDEGAGVHKDKGAGVHKEKSAGVQKDEGAGVHKNEGAEIHKDELHEVEVHKDEGAVGDMGVKGEAAGYDGDSDAGLDVGGDMWDQGGDFMGEDDFMEGEGSAGKDAVGKESNQDDGNPVLSSSQTEIFEEFKKLTSATEDQSSSSTKKRDRQEDSSEGTNVPTKKRRRAHAQAEKTVGIRNPVRVVEQAKITDSNFSTVLKDSDLYLGKKRQANKSSTPAATVKRPRLALNPNAKIATKLRQKYLDGYIDEHMKMGIPPEEAYQKALDEEQQLFEDHQGSRGSYMNKSYQALKQLQAAATEYQEEQRLISERRVEMAKQMSARELVEKSKAAKASRDQARKVEVAGRKSEKGKGGDRGGWMSLNDELQATFSQSLSVRQDAGMAKSVGLVESSSSKSTNLSSTAALKHSSTFEGALLDGSNFYGSKKSSKTRESQRPGAHHTKETHLRGGPLQAREARQKRKGELNKGVESRREEAQQNSVKRDVHHQVQGSRHKGSHHSGGSTKSHQQRDEGKALSSSSSSSSPLSLHMEHSHLRHSHLEQSDNGSLMKTASKSHQDRGSMKSHRKHQAWEEGESEHRESSELIKLHGSRSSKVHQKEQSTTKTHRKELTKSRERGGSHEIRTSHSSSHMMLEGGVPLRNVDRKECGKEGGIRADRNMEGSYGSTDDMAGYKKAGVRMGEEKGGHGVKKVDGAHYKVDGGRKIAEGSHKKSGGSDKVCRAEEGKMISNHSKVYHSHDKEDIDSEGRGLFADSGRTEKPVGAFGGGHVMDRRRLERPHPLFAGDGNITYQDRPASVLAGSPSGGAKQSKSVRPQLSLSSKRRAGVNLPKARVVYTRLEKGSSAGSRSRDERVGTDSACKSTPPELRPSGFVHSRTPCDITSGDVWDGLMFESSPAPVDLSSELFGSDSEESVVVVSDDSTGGGASSDHSPVRRVGSSHSPVGDAIADWFDQPDPAGSSSEEMKEVLPRRQTPPTCVILSSSSDDDDDFITGQSGLTFEDALSGIGTSQVRERRPQARRGMAWNSKVKVQMMDAGMTSPLSPVADSDLPAHSCASSVMHDWGRDEGLADTAQNSLFRKVPSLKLVRARLNRATLPARKDNTSQGKLRTPVSHVAGILEQLEGRSFTSSSDESSDDSSVLGYRPEDRHKVLTEPRKTSFSLSVGKLRSDDFDLVDPTLRQTGASSPASGRPRKGSSSDLFSEARLQAKKGSSSVFMPGLQAKKAESLELQKNSSSVFSDRPRKASDSGPISPMAELVPLGKRGDRPRKASDSGPVSPMAELVPLGKRGDRPRKASDSGPISPMAELVPLGKRGDRPRKASDSGPVSTMAELVPLGKRKTSSSSSYEDSVRILTTVGAGSTANVLTADMAGSSDPVHKPCGPFISLSKVALEQKQHTASLHKASLQKVGHPPKISNTRTSQQRRSQQNTGTRTKPSAPAKPGPTHSPTPKANCAVLKKKAVPPLTSDLFYAQMWSYTLTADQLYDNGYPRPTPEEGVAFLNREGDTIWKVQRVGPNAVRHECCRCRTPFIIYNDGQYQTVESCSYHYGRPYKNREYGEGVVSKYSCCQERSGSPGCQLAKLHVTAGETLTKEPGYVQTTPDEDNTSKQAKQVVYALDCEMSYTTVGLELTRVTVVNMNLQPVYETLVKPRHTIVDYNTRFSGLTAQDFIGVNTTLPQVQQRLLQLFSSETILLGHSLESDFKALKLIHNCVVDTAIVFPHKLGPPYKRALKTLAKEVLHKFIQNDIDDGHDSLEDSLACMELMLWKVKGDVKAMCRRSSTSRQ